MYKTRKNKNETEREYYGHCTGKDMTYKTLCDIDCKYLTFKYI